MAYFSDAVPGQTASVVAAYNALRNVGALSPVNLSVS